MGYYLRKALKEDCELIFKWANDELVRRNSFNNNKIEYEQHIKWFNNKLELGNVFFFIFCFQKNNIGMVRIDMESDENIISYSIDKKYRGKGLSIIMLGLLEKEIKDKDINELIGYVKFYNKASQKVFEKLNYIKYENDDCLKYCKEIL